MSSARSRRITKSDQNSCDCQFMVLLMRSQYLLHIVNVQKFLKSTDLNSNKICTLVKFLNSPKPCFLDDKIGFCFRILQEAFTTSLSYFGSRALWHIMIRSTIERHGPQDNKLDSHATLFFSRSLIWK